MTKTIKLGSISIPITEYASQGNAILGIRDSGKSYTATWLAERLLDAGIPFVAFDPIGIWKYLRVTGKGKGYPVVVAGGRNADLPLTPQSAPEIVRAAMRENIPLVIDLYDIHLSKGDWKQIVEQSVRLLLYENGDHGLRHIFIEEAAEFCPQRVGPDQGRVYAEIEKLARMGGNARLGYTLINQRGEEVNKAVLELCDCLFLHRQKGRNSLTALGKWLDIGSVSASKPIMESLPTLPQGDCWVWTAGSNVPVRVHVPEKSTFHPNRRATDPAHQAKVYNALDVSAFVTQMSGALEIHLQDAKENDPSELKREIARLRKELTGQFRPAVEVKTERVEVPVIPESEFMVLRETLREIQSKADEIIAIGENAKQFTQAVDDILLKAAETVLNFNKSKPVTMKLSGKNYSGGFDLAKKKDETVREIRPSVSGEITNPQQRILDAMAWMESVHLFRPKRTIVAFLAGQSPKSSGFKNNLGFLRSAGFLIYSGNDALELTNIGRNQTLPFEIPITAEEVQIAVLSRLPRPKASILQVLIDAYPNAVDRVTLAGQAGQSPNSSGYKNNLGALRSLGVIDYAGPDAAKALPVLFLE